MSSAGRWASRWRFARARAQSIATSVISAISKRLLALSKVDTSKSKRSKPAACSAGAAHPKKRRAAEDRRVDAPAALELADAPFASRAFDVLMALADAHREARDDAILRGLKTARTALAPHLNPLQRRKLDTTHSTMKATRGLVSDGC